MALEELASKVHALGLEEFMTVAGGSPGTGVFQANVASLRGEVQGADRNTEMLMDLLGH